MMYQEHFGLNRPPFKITPDTSLFYKGNKRGAALDALTYAIKSGEGIVKVVGEVGSGKTMLCRMLELKLTSEVDVVYIANPSLSPDNILHVIAHEMQLSVENTTIKLEVMQKIYKYLLEKHANNRQVVVFVEEAQSMPIETLEEIRLLSNLETDHNKLLQMILFGQPELDVKLRQPHIRQLKERITHNFYLDPFPPEDTLDYLNFRLRAVGYRGPDIFNKKTAGVVKKYSGGLTRRINIIADKALMASFSEGKHEVTTKHVRTAAADSEFGDTTNLKPWFLGAGVVASLILAVWIGTLFGPETSKDAINTAVLQTENQPVAMFDSEVIDRGSSSLLAQRMRGTEQWLLRMADDHFSIQLFMAYTTEADAVEQFLQNVPEMLEFDKIYIYETTINGSHMYSVLYDGYPSRQAALLMLRNLPENLQTSKPFVRRVGALRRDLLRNG